MAQAKKGEKTNNFGVKRLGKGQMRGRGHKNSMKKEETRELRAVGDLKRRNEHHESRDKSKKASNLSHLGTPSAEENDPRGGAKSAKNQKSRRNSQGLQPRGTQEKAGKTGQETRGRAGLRVPQS